MRGGKLGFVVDDLQQTAARRTAIDDGENVIAANAAANALIPGRKGHDETSWLKIMSLDGVRSLSPAEAFWQSRSFRGRGVRW
jgi:hypothetical protein